MAVNKEDLSPEIDLRNNIGNRADDIGIMRQFVRQLLLRISTALVITRGITEFGNNALTLT
ncbi:MAG: hypothetical protein JWQ14_2020 [Adhaeribacter sp.]|nr:hypothetical protein [Adhaeribacter sp.]